MEGIALKEEQKSGRVKKGSVDPCDYSLIRLENKLKVLLVHDDSVLQDKGGAAMDISVGYSEDPSAWPGLAHFCEHLLFMGTSKFPEENSFNELISKHGGSSNAFTSSSHTNYYFELNSEGLEEALDRFSQFFISPLFREESIDREIQSVDSEFKKNVLSDDWRLLELEKFLGHPEHSSVRFGVGNSTTLNLPEDPHHAKLKEALFQFFHQYYVAAKMTLVISGKQSLKELEDWAKKYFSNIPTGPDTNDPTPNTALSPEMYSQHELLKLVLAVPKKDMKLLKVTFPIPDQLELRMRETQAGNFVRHLIIQEGKGTFYQSILKQGLIINFRCDISDYGPKSSLLELFFELTEEGFRNVYQELELLSFLPTEDINNTLSRSEEVESKDERYHHKPRLLKQLFHFLQQLQTIPPSILESIYKDTQVMSSLFFHYRDSPRNMSSLSNMAGWMQRGFADDDVISAPFLMKEFDIQCIQSILSSLHPNNFRILLASKSFSDPPWRHLLEEEQWYGTLFHEWDIPESVLNVLKKCRDDSQHHKFKICTQNPFIPTKILANMGQIHNKIDEPAEPTAPFLIKDTPLSRIWYKSMNEFKIPKVYSWISLQSPLAYSTPRCCVLIRAFCEILMDTLNEELYEARISGLEFNVDNQTEGILMTFSGYYEKMDLLISKVVNKMKCLQIDPKIFHRIKEKLIQCWSSFELEAPYVQAMYYTTFAVQDVLFTSAEKIEVIKDISSQDIYFFSKTFFKDLYIEGAFFGPISEKDCLRIANSIEMTLHCMPLSPSLRNQPRAIILASGKECICTKDLSEDIHLSSALEYFCQVGDDLTPETSVLCQLLSDILYEPCFNQLRSQEQLGYIVFLGIRKQLTTTGIRIIIQSELDTFYLERRVDHFLKKSLDMIKEMEQGVFEQHISNLKSETKNRGKTFYQQSASYWRPIQLKTYDFDRETRHEAYLNTVTKDDVIRFYKNFLDPSSPSRSKFSMHMRSPGCSNKLPTDALFSSASSYLYSNERRPSMCLAPLSPQRSSLVDILNDNLDRNGRFHLLPMNSRPWDEEDDILSLLQFRSPPDRPSFYPFLLSYDTTSTPNSKVVTWDSQVSPILVSSRACEYPKLNSSPNYDSQQEINTGRWLPLLSMGPHMNGVGETSLSSGALNEEFLGALSMDPSSSSSEEESSYRNSPKSSQEPRKSLSKVIPAPLLLEKTLKDANEEKKRKGWLTPRSNQEVISNLVTFKAKQTMSPTTHPVL